MKALRIILSLIKKADLDFNLIKENSKICIGISGGKDSMALFYCLNLYKKYAKVNFEIYPLHINLGFPSNSIDELNAYFKTLGYDLIISDQPSVYEILKIQQDKQNLNKLPCSICSKMKKAIINKEAHKLNCETVSFAHHKNDAIETLFLNEIYGGRVATFSPKMHLTRENITFIRPFIYVDESLIERLIKEENIPIFKSSCPNDKKTERENIKNIIKSINKEYIESKDNFLTMMLNEEKLDLFFLHYDHKIEYTPLSLKKVDSISSFIDETNFLGKPFLLKDFTHYHVYLNEELYGVFVLKQDEKDFELQLLKIKEPDYLELLIFDFYQTLYSKYNPLRFKCKIPANLIESFKLLNVKLIDNNEENLTFEIDENPSHISKRIKAIS